MSVPFLSSNLPPAINIPFLNPLKSPQFAGFTNATQNDIQRLQRYRQSLLFYVGQHYSYQREDGEPLVTINYVRKFVDKIAEFMVGGGLTIKVHEALEYSTKPILDDTWKKNNKEQFTLDAALMGGISGDVFVMPTFEAPTEFEKKLYPYTQGRIRIMLLGSEQVYPQFDRTDQEKLISVRIETLYYDDHGQSQGGPTDANLPNQGSAGLARFTQTITPDIIVEQFHGEAPIVRTNPLGEIPLVHIKNLPLPKEYFGIPDTMDLLELQRQMNEKSTDVSDVITYHAAPNLLIFGAKTKQLETGARKIMSGLPSDARVEYLQLNGELQASVSYIERIKMSMHEIGDVPEGVLGKTQPISNTSGVALHIQYQPLLGRVARKKLHYEPGFEKINYFILRIAAIEGMVQLPNDLCSKCGGKIVQVATDRTRRVWNEEMRVYQEVPLVEKRCYHVDKETLEFMKPEEMRLKIWANYGFGRELKERKLIDIVRQIDQQAPSFWDYTQLQESLRAPYEKLMHIANGLRQGVLPGQNPHVMVDQVKIPDVLKTIFVPDAEIDVPEEPEFTTVIREWSDPATGEIVERTQDTMLIVPTGCKHPVYLNPYDTECEFNDILPKDEALEAQLFAVYQDNRWVDETWCQQQISRIRPEASEIRRRMRMKEAREERMTPSQITDTEGGVATVYSAGTANGPGGDLTPGGTAGEQLGQVPGNGGNPTPVTNQLPPGPDGGGS